MKWTDSKYDGEPRVLGVDLAEGESKTFTQVWLMGKRKRLVFQCMGLLGMVAFLSGCQGWLHGGELALHGPDARIERNHRAMRNVVIDVLEADYAAAEKANVVGQDGKVKRDALEKQFRLLRFKALQIKVIDRMLHEAAAYNGVDLESKAGETRSLAGGRAKKLRGYIEDIAKDEGKDLAKEVLKDLRKAE